MKLREHPYNNFAGWTIVVVTGLLALVVIALIIYQASVRNYFPNEIMRVPAIASATFLGLLTGGSALFNFRKGARIGRDKSSPLIHVAIAIACGSMFAFMSACFIVGPLSYAFHKASKKTKTAVSLHVESSVNGAKRCRMFEKIQLEGNSFVTPRTVCDKSGKSGKTLYFYGHESKYGFDFENYNRR